MSTKFQFRIKLFVIVCINTLLCSVAVSQTDKGYTPTDKRTKNFKKSGEVVSKPKPKKKSIAKTKNEFGPVKAIFSFFDDSMFEFGPAEITDTYTYDDESMYEFGSAESSSEFYDESAEEFGPANRPSRHRDLSTENFQPVRPNEFSFIDNLLDFFHLYKTENYEQPDLAFSNRGATVKAGVVRKTPIFVSRFPCKEELKHASEKSFIGKSQSTSKPANQVIQKPKPVNDSKEIISPR